MASRGEVVDGDGRRRFAGVAVGAAAGVNGGGNAPVALGGGSWVAEHRWEVGELVGESIWVEEGRKRGFHGERRSAAALPATAAPGGDGDGRGLAVELHRGEEVPFRGLIWTEGHRG